MIEIISRLDLYQIYWNNGLIITGTGAKVHGRSNQFAVFDWPTVEVSIRAGIISVHDKYDYRPQGDPDGELNCSEISFHWANEMLLAYESFSGFQLGAVPWAGGITDGYFTDMPNPMGHHGRDSMIVNVSNGTGGYVKRVALIEPQRSPDDLGVIRLAVGAGPNSNIGDGDSVSLVVF